MKISKLFFLLVLLLIPSLSHALTGKVVSIADGDTVTILDNTNQQQKIRLYGIDTPEKGQAFGDAAKKYTSKLVAGKTVDVKVYDTDNQALVDLLVAKGIITQEELMAKIEEIRQEMPE